MTTQTTRRTFVAGAAVAATALGSLALLRSGDAGLLESGVIQAAPDFQPLSAGAAASAEVRQWAAAIGAPVRLSSADGGMTGRIHQVLSAPPQRRLPAGVREQQFIVYFEVDKTHAPLTDRTYDITAPIEGLSRLYMSLAQDRGAKAILLAVFA